MDSSTGWAKACGELSSALVTPPARLGSRVGLGLAARLGLGRGLGFGSDSASGSSTASSSAISSSIAASAAARSSSAAPRRRQLRRLGLLDRLQLLLGRQLAALGHDEHARLDRHLREELDRNLVAADPLQRLVEVDLPAVDPDLELVPDRVREVRLRDRPEEDARLAGLDVEAELRLAEPLRDLLRLLEALRLVAARGARSPSRAP